MQTPPPQTYPLSLHDALPISATPRRRPPRGSPTRRGSCTATPPTRCCSSSCARPRTARSTRRKAAGVRRAGRSEEHTSELQSLRHLVCRLLLEKKKVQHTNHG